MAEGTVNETAVVEAEKTDSGRIIFADDVVATIAALAAADVEGVASLSGGMVEGFTERLGVKKNLTKGVKVEVGTEEAAIDLSINVKFGYRIREVCEKIQEAVKNGVETMTGLKVVEVNVFVQSVTFEPTEPSKAELREQKKKEKDAQKEADAAAKAAEEAEAAAAAAAENAPRVK